jgi:hypothetical protein
MGAFVKYFDIQQITENKRTIWIAWFYEDVKDFSKIKQEAD